ncbi:hypothetical protein D3C75_232800 [compost metagenome]
MYKYSYNQNVDYIVSKKHAQLERIAMRLKGRKAIVELKRTKTRSVLKVFY